MKKFVAGDQFPPRSVTVARHMLSALSLSGDIVELGVYQGATTIAMARHLKNRDIKKVIYACDTYEGLPYDGHKWEPRLTKGRACARFDYFWKNVVDAGVEDYVIPIQGKVEDTLQELVEDKEFCFAVLDMDLYAPTSFATRVLQDRMVKHGVMGFHDYGFDSCPGIKRVVDNQIDYIRYQRFSNTESNYAWVKRQH